jgi:hypothetical protein
LDLHPIPMRIHYRNQLVLTMTTTSAVTVHELQLAVLHEINLLSQPRQGVIEMEVDLRLALMPLPPCFVKPDICSVIDTNSLSKALIYFRPQYTFDKKGREALYCDIQRAALIGGDRLTLWGRGKVPKQEMYICCQCSPIYRGSKVDKVTGSLLGRTDYRNATYCNNRKNQRHGQTGRNASHRTGAECRLTSDEGRCPFSLAVFQDESGYYMKSKKGSVLHQFHSRRDHLRSSISLLQKEEVQLQGDLNSARAKLGSTANLHYVKTRCEGTPTLLSRDQIAHLCIKEKGVNTAG